MVGQENFHNYIVAFIKIVIYDNNVLMAIISPTERLIYYQLEFLLLCFASEFNSLVQFFQRTSNICLKKGFIFACYIGKLIKKISRKSESSGEFFGNYFQMEREWRGQHQLIVN